MLGGENLRAKDFVFLFKVLVLFSASRYNFPKKKLLHMGFFRMREPKHNFLYPIGSMYRIFTYTWTLDDC